ncbi:MAG: glycosyltransferase [Clostridia bacterium]|nr:glycosyltransferase [Clostridia bacterium]
MKVSVIIPAYNEEAIIEQNMKELEAQCEKMLEDFEIVVVSDGSTDSTQNIVRDKLASKKIIDAGYPDNRGKGGALKAGVFAASGDIVVTTDCDLAYGCDVIWQAVDIMKKDKCDVLIGSRSIADDGFAGYPFIRKLMSKVYFKMLSLYAGLSVSDSQCGFKCYSANAAKTLFGELKTASFAFDLEILLRAKAHGCTLREMPVTIKNHGVSKINIIKDSIKMLADVARIKKLCASDKMKQ